MSIARVSLCSSDGQVLKVFYNVFRCKSEWKGPTVAEQQEHVGPVAHQPQQRSSVRTSLRPDAFGLSLRQRGRNLWFVLKYCKGKHQTRPVRGTKTRSRTPTLFYDTAGKSYP